MKPVKSYAKSCVCVLFQAVFIAFSQGTMSLKKIKNLCSKGEVYFLDSKPAFCIMTKHLQDGREGPQWWLRLQSPHLPATLAWPPNAGTHGLGLRLQGGLETMSWLRADTRIRMRMGISWTNTPSPPWREEPTVTYARPGWREAATVQTGHGTTRSPPARRFPKHRSLSTCQLPQIKTEQQLVLNTGGRWVYTFACE